MNCFKNFIKLSGSHHISIRHTSFIKSLKNIFKVEKYSPPYSHLVQIGDPCLRTNSDPIPVDLIKSPEIIEILNRMEYVRKSYQLVGIAAPQVGINLRIFIACFDENVLKSFEPSIQQSKKMSILPLTVFINPEIKILDHRKITFEESCGSFIGYAADVARALSCEITWFNEEGEENKQKFTGWNARIVQHEIDHLNGILFTDLMNPKTLRCTNYHIINQKAGRVEIPFYPKK